MCTHTRGDSWISGIEKLPVTGKDYESSKKLNGPGAIPFAGNIHPLKKKA